MKKVLVTLVLLVSAMFVCAQTELNSAGEYELKVVKEYPGMTAGNIFDKTLIVLSDIKGGSEFSKFNFDVKEKDSGIIVYKGRLFIGYRKVNISGGYDYLADVTLKVRIKEGKAQYTITVPTMTLFWHGNPNITDQVPLTNVLPKVNYKGKLYYVKKGLTEFGPKIANTTKEYIDDIVNKTSTAEDDF